MLQLQWKIINASNSAGNEEQIEEGRKLINKIFPLHQHILRKDRELIPSNKAAEILTGTNRELILAYDQETLVGAVVLGIARDYAWASHLVRDSNASKGVGAEVLKWAEDRAKDTHKRNRMQLSVVSHPDCEQKRLQDWYKEEQKYEHFGWAELPPELLEDLESKFHKDVILECYRKELK